MNEIEMQSVELPVLDLGLRGAAVLNLQFLIKAMQVRVDEDGNLTPGSLKCDAIFGHETEEAVKALQRAYGLPESGIVGAATWQRLFPGPVAGAGWSPSWYESGVVFTHVGDDPEVQ
jgi:peptidoglycan hydrolase-like protein with peptidoglycan-binding domain